MNSATDYRSQAAVCRKAAKLSKRKPTAYLIALAEDYERRAAQLESVAAGRTPAFGNLKR